MITGEIKSKVDTLWNAFWTGGISNPLEVIEQITYLLFLKRLAGSRSCGRRRKVHAGSGQSAVCGFAGLRELCQGFIAGGQDEEDRVALLGSVFKIAQAGGRAAIIVPDGVLFGSSNAHKTLRKVLVEEQKLDAVISLPGGVFKPYAGVSTAILLFTKTNSGGTDHVWFYDVDVDADGMSLDDKRTELLPTEKLGPVPKVALTASEHSKNNLPDILARWRSHRAYNSLAPGGG